MKINWGVGIVIAFVLFMSFIMYFVFKVQSNSKYDNELVVEEYYKHDSHFGEEMEKIQNAEDLKQKPSIVISAQGVTIVFPSIYDPKKIKGKVSFYRPSAKKLDFDIPLSSSSSTLLIPENKLAGGRWDIILEWDYDGKSYIYKEQVNL
jgi:hypothetical protein